jgi:gliding motility-associated-like protein
MNMRQFFQTLICTFVLAGLSFSAFATHTAGGELIYDLVPGTTNTYLFTFKFYRACAYQPTPGGGWSNSSAEPASFTMCYYNTCTNSPQNIQLTKVVGNIGTIPPVPNGSVMGNGCDSITTTCETLTATVPGFEEWWYQGTVTLPTTCNFWKFYVYLCCRNNGILNIGTPAGNSGAEEIYVETTFDNTVNNINNSPRFTYSGLPTSIPIPYICINSPYFHNGSGIDPDGDSLYYETIIPESHNGCNTGAPAFILSPGFNTLNTAGNPMSVNNTYNLNTSNGTFTMTPNQLGLWVISQRISEYRNGVLIGSVMRDMQVVVDNCVPLNASSILDSLSLVGGNIQNDTVKTCPGSDLTFCFDINAAYGTYLLQLFDNHATAFPGSTITYQNTADSVLRVCLNNWTSSISNVGLNLLQITVKDSFNCQTTPATIQMPVIVLQPLQSSNDTSICLGDAAQFNTTGNGSYQWSVLPGGSGLGSLSCLNCPNPVVTPTTTTTYVVTDLLCDYKDSITVTVAEGPLLTITPDTTTCANAQLQLNVTVTNPGTQTFSYTWTPTTFLSNPNISNPVMNNPTAPINYTVTVVPQGVLACSSQADIQVDVLLGYNILNNDTTICDGDAVQIITTGGNPKYSYQWTPTTFVSNPNSINPSIAPTPAGTYNYALTASFPGCPDSTQDIDITVEPLPIVNAGSDREMCQGDSVHLHGSVTPASSLYTYAWLPAANLDNNTTLDVAFDGLTNTALTLTATTPSGCVGFDIVVVNVLSVDFLNIDGDRSLCPNDTAQLHVNGGVSYLWQPSRWVSDSTANNVVVNPVTTTQFFVYGTDANGCRDTVYANVVVNSAAILEAGDDKTLYPGESVELNADGNCSLNFNWFPPNGLSSTTIKNPIAQPSVTTQYQVTAQTEAGCTGIDTVTVIVSPESLVELPNAFSPGSGTSMNDELRIIVKGLAQLTSFRIYNRWGQEVFSTTDINKGWNGQYNGKPQPMGTYVFVFEGKTQSGKKFYKQGNVTLIR